ncbi:GntR family transcriptional regulator [Candidatus Galacturonibacter soehngenii]|uniref:GntR family transcriptional regulator n=1 Tax=Candidatus Galacturonatibacter soehngenii TaxID=2307010 RepID=A0A7V7QNI8_9FIRM|nr:GntR family transcriptional regulator [Candidatus Galacturonibacter soehngenii]KAB1440586.1 GntR family transcriptional regulator [Candidatus Galacturonibacter soehngenii]MBA4687844.1 GntR family transcriptional regulator [Candidatus Galacturonibacter soehngenii]
MTWNLNSDRPIYSQLIDKLKMDIISGVYNPGDKIPSVRELAADASVNPNTMQKALAELERDGLVFSQRTSGRFITEDKNMIKNVKNQLAIEQITEFFERMNQLGYKKEETIKLIESALRGKENE